MTRLFFGLDGGAMHCEKCGVEIEDGLTTCSKCGAEVPATDAKAANAENPVGGGMILH